MTLALSQVTGTTMVRLAGIGVAAGGALLLGQTDPFASTWPAALTPSGMHLDWLLLAGLVCIVVGGLLVQVTWDTRHG